MADLSPFWPSIIFWSSPSTAVRVLTSSKGIATSCTLKDLIRCHRRTVELLTDAEEKAAIYIRSLRFAIKAKTKKLLSGMRDLGYFHHSHSTEVNANACLDLLTCALLSDNEDALRLLTPTPGSCYSHLAPTDIVKSSDAVFKLIADSCLSHPTETDQAEYFWIELIDASVRSWEATKFTYLTHLRPPSLETCIYAYSDLESPRDSENCFAGYLKIKEWLEERLAAVPGSRILEEILQSFSCYGGYSIHDYNAFFGGRLRWLYARGTYATREQLDSVGQWGAVERDQGGLRLFVVPENAQEALAVCKASGNKKGAKWARAVLKGQERPAWMDDSSDEITRLRFI